MKNDKNILLVLSSPSGAGKTTLTKKIQQKFNSFKISVSHTTRKPRPNEVDGIDYNFVSIDEFKKKIQDQKFYEYARNIDWQGNKQLSNFKNLNLLKIFITTADKNDLKERLLKRNQDSENEVEKRLKSYEEDINHWSDYDYVVINKNLENCFRQIENIILTEKNYPFSINSTSS